MAIGKKIFIIIGILVLVIVGAAIVFIQTAMPYSITVNDKDVAIVNGEMTAKQVKNAIINDYKADNSTVIKSSFDKKIGIDKMNITDLDDYDQDDVMTKEEAIKFIEKKNADGKALFTATVVGKTEGVEDYTPKTVYKKDETMYAGESRVETESKDGTRNVVREITTVNGEETSNKITDSKVIEKGTAAVIYKGVIGLPEGEDWETYEGEPVFDGGDDLVDIATLYQGVPYKYGGRSLITGVDCVTFVCMMYEKYGINLPYSHKGLRKSGIGVSYSNMKPGDVLCYSKHVAIYMGNGKIIHATHGKGVHISDVYHGQKLVTIRRIAE